MGTVGAQLCTAWTAFLSTGKPHQSTEGYSK